MTTSYEDVKDFLDYVIVTENGWTGLTDDAPDSAKIAYQKYVETNLQKDENGFIIKN